MAVIVTPTPFAPYQELAKFEQANLGARGQVGAAAVFIGTMRDYNEGTRVRGMTLEHYPGMTERHLETLCKHAIQRWQLLETLIIHRVGEINPGEPIVLVAVWSGHRAEAFDACRAIMEDLKSSAPFWKKEQLEDGARWVTENTPGSTAQAGDTHLKNY